MSQSSSPKTWIQITPNLVQGVQVINKLDNQKLVLYLSRVAQSLCEDLELKKPFTDEEEERLLTTLTLDREELTSLLQTSFVILTQAVYDIIKPEELKSALASLSLNNDKVHVFVTVWSNHAKRLVGVAKQKTIYTTQLEDVSWLMNIETSSSDDLQKFFPKANLQLKLKERDRKSNLNLQLDESQLFYLYNVMENIQSELDSLN